MKTCSQCFHWQKHPMQIGSGHCYGAPPVPMAISQGGQAGVMMARPMTPAGERACGAFELNPVLDNLPESANS